jgi:Arc/MetJ-type ribon-helix-helix transcriptional regulator
MRHQRTIRLSEKVEKAIDEATRQRGFASSAAFVRYAIEQELTGRADDLTGAEERLGGSIEAVRRDLFRVMRVQQALFAYLDTLAKTFLTCVPEPPVDAKAQAVARAKERHDRLLKSAGRAMVGESKLAMHDLTEHAEG